MHTLHNVSYKYVIIDVSLYQSGMFLTSKTNI